MQDEHYAEQLKKATTWTNKQSPAIGGQGGHNQTMMVAGVLIQKFQITESDTFTLMKDWNILCRPPWTDAELRHKIKEAVKNKGKYTNDEPAPKTKVAEYIYQNADGKEVYRKIRYYPKDFRITPAGAAKKNPWLYNYPAVKKAIDDYLPILLVEGEKDADTANSLGFVATTDPFGAGGWRDAFSEQLRGGDIYIIPDKDETGYKGAINRCQSLLNTANAVRIIDIPWKEKDLTDWVVSNKDTKHYLNLSEICFESQPFTQADLDAYKTKILFPPPPIPEAQTADILPTMIEDEQGNINNTDMYGTTDCDDIEQEDIPPKNYIINNLVEKGDLVFFAGKSKSGKSTSLLNMAVNLAVGGMFANMGCKPCKVLYFSLEDKNNTVKRRVKSISHKLNVKPGKNLHFILRDQLMIRKPDGDYISYARDLLRYNQTMVEANQDTKFDVIVIDPMYCLGPSINESDSKEMGEMARKVRSLCLEFGVTLIVSTHSKKGSVADLEAEEATAGSGIVGRIGECYISLAPHQHESWVIARFKLRDDTNPQAVVWSFEDYPRMQVLEDEDPTLFKDIKKMGRPSIYSATQILDIVKENNGYIKSDRLYHLVKEKTGMSQRKYQEFIKELRDAHKIHFNYKTSTYSIISEDDLQRYR